MLKKAFTLIELLVVVSIIGILAAVVIVSVSGARRKANDAKVKSDIQSIMSASELHLASVGNGQFCPAAQSSTGTTFSNTIANSFTDTDANSCTAAAKKIMTVAPVHPLSPNEDYSWRTGGTNNATTYVSCGVLSDDTLFVGQGGATFQTAVGASCPAP